MRVRMGLAEITWEGIVCQLGCALVMSGALVSALVGEVGAQQGAPQMVPMTPLVSSIADRWRVAEDTLATARFKGVIYRGGRPGLKLTPAEVEQKVLPLLASGHREALQSLQSQFCRTDLGFVPHWGDQFEILFRNGMLRERWRLHDGEENEVDRLYNGERSSDYRLSNRQYDVYDGCSFFAYLSPDRLRNLPRGMLDYVSESRREGGRTSLRSADWEMEIDESSGLITTMRINQPDGKVLNWVGQYEAIISDDGQVFPKHRIAMSCDLNGDINFLEVVSLTSFESNIRLDDSDFRMIAQPNAKVVDYREMIGDRYRVVMTGAGGQDVFSLADLPINASHRGIVGRGLGWQAIVFGVFVVGLWWLLRVRPRRMGGIH